MSRPVQPKQPLALETVVRIPQAYNTISASLADIRFLFVLFGYAGLFRISELLNVKVKDISISDVGMTIFISQRKNDQFREGHTSVTAVGLVRFHAQWRSQRELLPCYQPLRNLVFLFCVE